MKPPSMPQWKGVNSIHAAIKKGDSKHVNLIKGAQLFSEYTELEEGRV